MKKFLVALLLLCWIGRLQYGVKYEQVISINDANGKAIDVTFVGLKNQSGVVDLVTAISTKL